MPYIKPTERLQFENVLNLLNDHCDNLTAGELNYFISSIIWKAFDENTSYSKANELIGVLECVKQEFYRRKVVPYEEEKTRENGDLL